MQCRHYPDMICYMVATGGKDLDLVLGQPTGQLINVSAHPADKRIKIICKNAQHLTVRLAVEDLPSI